MASQELRNDQTGELGRFHLINGQQRFIPNEVDPASEEGALSAGLIAAGRSASEIPQRAAAAFGDPQAAEQLADTEQLLGSLTEAHPIASAVGEAIPGFAVPGGKLAQIGVGAVEGALADPENPFFGAATGATLGLVGQKAGDAIGAAATRKLQEMSRSTARRATARAARTVEGADKGVLSDALTIGERTGDPVALSVERAASTALGRSLKGGRRQTNLNRQFDKALGGRGDVDVLTNEVLGGHSNRIGKVFEDAAANVEEIPISQQFSDALGGLRETAEELVPNSRAMKQLDIIENMTLGDKMTGKQYLRLRTRLGKISRAEWSAGGDAVSGEFVDDMITALDDMFAEAAPGAAEALGKARGEWRVLIAARKGAALDPRGNVNPNAMQGALEKVFPGVDRAQFAQGATGAAQRLNVASQQFPVEASSRTAERLSSFNPLRQATAAILNAGGGTGGQLGGGLAREVGINDADPAQ